MGGTQGTESGMQSMPQSMANQGQFNALNQIGSVGYGGGGMPQGGASGKGGGMGQTGGNTIPGSNAPNEPMQKPNSPLTPVGQGSGIGGTNAPQEPLQKPNGGPSPMGQPNSPYGPLTPPPQGLQPQGNGQQSLVGGGIGTPYWQGQYQQNPQNVQNYYSPPAANQLGQFYPGQQIFPGVQGAGSGTGGANSGGMGGQSKGGGVNPGGGFQGAGAGQMPLKQVVGNLPGGANA